MSSERSAFLFPGQGEEGPGMAPAGVLALAEVRRLLDCGSAHSGADLAKLVRNGGPELTRTELLQPALVALCLGLAHELQEREGAPHAVAGHSLGELSAFAAAGCKSAERAVELAGLRGALMAEAARRAPGAMIALPAGCTEAQLAEALACGRAADPALDVAAHNGPGSWVLSGSRAALRAVQARFAVALLPVAGPWHSRSMQEAEQAFASALRAVPLSAPRTVLIANCTGLPVAASDDPASLLAGQLTRPVQWAATMRSLQLAGATRFVTVGPSRVLRGLCRACLGPDARLVMANAAVLADQERVA